MHRQGWRKLPLSLPTRRAALAGMAAIAACDSKNATKPILRGDSQKLDLPNGGSAWLTRYDITKTAIDHIALEAPTQRSEVGEYYPASQSPPFTRVDATAVLRNYQAKHGPAVEALINCSFFERYDAVTELSFPIKRTGLVLTGGSSPYGPCEYPKDDRYKKVTLKALVWNDQAVKIVDYDHKTGGVLNDQAFSDGLVTYNYVDHPANVLAGDPVGQYQLMGIGASQHGALPVELYVLTITQGRMADGAALMRRHGVIGPVLTVDGGPSTHLWHKAAGAVIATKSEALPHFLGFRARA
jgi:hypothetical protein